MAKVEQDVEVEIDVPKSLKFKKTIGKIKYILHEEELKLIIDIKKMSKGIKHLHKQLNEANEVINVVQGKIEEEPEIKTKAEENCWKVLEDYKVKWGVK